MAALGPETGNVHVFTHRDAVSIGRMRVCVGSEQEYESLQSGDYFGSREKPIAGFQNNAKTIPSLAVTSPYVGALGKDGSDNCYIAIVGFPVPESLEQDCSTVMVSFLQVYKRDRIAQYKLDGVLQLF